MGDDFTVRYSAAGASEKQRGTQGILPKSPAESLATIKVRDGLRVELVAAEPLVQDPVAIDFGRTASCGSPRCTTTGKDGKIPARRPRQGARRRDGDGTFETATTFLESLPCRRA